MHRTSLLSSVYVVGCGNNLEVEVINNNTIKWNEDLMDAYEVNPSPVYPSATTEVLLKEAQEYILRLEESVEFWKDAHKAACQDYDDLRERYDALVIVASRGV